MSHHHGAAEKILEHRNRLSIPERRDQGLRPDIASLPVAGRQKE